MKFIGYYNNWLYFEYWMEEDIQRLKQHDTVGKPTNDLSLVKLHMIYETDGYFTTPWKVFLQF